MREYDIPLRTAELFDLSHTLARPWLARTEYPWEILNDIPTIIREIGATLDADHYHTPTKGVWIARTATVADTARITPPAIIGENTEVRQGAFLRGGTLVGDGCVVGNSTELKNCILFDGVQRFPRCVRGHRPRSHHNSYKSWELYRLRLQNRARRYFLQQQGR